MDGHFSDTNSADCPDARRKISRRMERAQLMGRHTHPTVAEVDVHIWRRGGRYLVRGRYQGQPFGATLGEEDTEAEGRLRQLLTAIENGSFTRPSEARKSPLPTGRVPRLSVRELANEFLVEKRRLRGRKTADTYCSRLAPVLDFAELPENRKRWPWAQDIDHHFALNLRTFLHQSITTRNGRASGTPKHFSSSQIFNDMDTLRTMLTWAQRADVRKLPPIWINPLTPEIVGQASAKDPLAAQKLTMDLRVQLIGIMDSWQLCQLALSLVLPLRPSEATGLLVSDVEFDKCWLSLGTRFGGSDFTKGKTSFKLPFPDELRPILSRCISGRSEGPLLRCRKVSAGVVRCAQPSSRQQLAQAFEVRLAKAAPNSVLNENDRKDLFRKLLIDLGGAEPDDLAKEFKRLIRSLGSPEISLKDARNATTTDMKRCGINLLDLRYLTSHSTADILNAYVTLDPVGAMARYFQTIRPLLQAIQERTGHLGL